MSEGKFEEPWVYEEIEGNELGCRVFDAADECILESELASMPERARRIVTCVNAFAAIPDPAAELTQLRGIEEAVKIFLPVAIHAAVCKMKAGAEGLDADQMCECGLAILRTALGDGEKGGG